MTGTGGPPAAVSSGRVPWAALLVLMLGTFMGVLDASIVNVALPRIMAIFNTSYDHIQWVMTIYLLVGGVVIPITGYLGDRYGYKLLYALALVFFTVASGLCGLAWSADALIGARAFQAIGGGMVIPLSQAIIYQIVPRDKIGIAMGVWGLTMTVAPAVGPTLGGYLVDNFSWRLIFYINLPVGLINVFLVAFILKELQRQPGLKFDFPGFLLCGAGCFCLLLALSEGQNKGWGSQYIVTLLAVSFFTLLLFALWELYTDHPMLDVRLLRNRVLTASIIALSLCSIAMFGAIFLVPIFAQNVQGYTPMQTGLIMMPMALAGGLVMPLCGKIFDKFGALPPSLFGLAIVFWTTYELHNLDADTPMRWLQAWLVLRGVGMGFAMMPIMTAGMNTVPKFLVGRASALTNVCRQIATSFGIAVLTYMLVQRQAFHTVRLAEATDIGRPAVDIGMGQVTAYLSGALGAVTAKTAAPGAVWGVLMQKATVLAVGDTFVFFAMMALPTFFFVLFLSRMRVEAARRAEERRFGRGTGVIG
ncbi:MAG: DHA2 family efflux MFS transporter permease subunit [Thermoanaerobacterales bacterium]|nr:DHA2 family efflux MFS transporter permease subunit [Thermoanaerobacterales bacterium]